MNLTKLIKPFEREFWEHRGAFVVTPLVLVTIASLLFIFALSLGHNMVDQYTGQFNHDEPMLQHDRGQDVRDFSSTDTVVGQVDDAISTPRGQWSDSDAHEFSEGIKTAHAIPYMTLGLVMLIIAFTYTLGGLFNDRKDRSILFWKSLPVSETQTVLTKLAVAVVLIPLVSWAAASLFNVVNTLILWVGMLLAGHGSFSGFILMSEKDVFVNGLGMLGAHIAYGLWILPIFSYGLFMSALAKKNPFLTGVIPLLVIAFAERVLLGSHYLVSTIKSLLAGKPLSDAPPVLAQGDWWALVHVITSQSFWVGVVVSLGFIIGAIWLRNHRYEI